MNKGRLIDGIRLAGSGNKASAARDLVTVVEVDNRRDRIRLMPIRMQDGVVAVIHVHALVTAVLCLRPRRGADLWPEMR